MVNNGTTKQNGFLPCVFSCMAHKNLEAVNSFEKFVHSVVVPQQNECFLLYGCENTVYDNRTAIKVSILLAMNV